MFLVVYCKFLFVLLVAGFLLKFSVSAVAVLATSAQYLRTPTELLDIGFFTAFVTLSINVLVINAIHR